MSTPPTTSLTDPPAKKKRGADRQITKDDREDPDQDDNDQVDLSRNIRTDPDLFKASDAVLKQRKIVKVARNANGTLDWSKKKSSNPFATVNLKANNSNNDSSDTTKEETKSTTTTKATTIFGSSTGFSGFGSTTTSGGGGFGSTTTTSGFGGFGSINNNNSSSNSNSSKPVLSFGSAKGFASVAAASGSTGFAFGSPATALQNKKEDDDKKEEKDTLENQTKKETATDNDNSDQKDNPTETTTEKDDSASASKDTATEAAAASILPTEYQVKSGEENETLLLECRCKTHRWGTTTTTTNSSAKENTTEEKTVVAAVPHSEAGFSANANNTEDKQIKDGNGDNAENKDKDEKEHDNQKASAGSGTAESQQSSKNSWHEVGVGPLRVLQAMPPNDTSAENGKGNVAESKATTELSESLPSSPKQPHSVRVVQRRQVNPSAAPTKVLLNVRLFGESTVSQPSEKHVQLTTPTPGAAALTTTAAATTKSGNKNDCAAPTATATSSSSSSTYLFKCGKAATALELFECLQKEIKSAPACFTKKE